MMEEQSRPAPAATGDGPNTESTTHNCTGGMLSRQAILEIFKVLCEALVVPPVGSLQGFRSPYQGAGPIGRDRDGRWRR